MLPSVGTTDGGDGGVPGGRHSEGVHRTGSAWSGEWWRRGDIINSPRVKAPGLTALPLTAVVAEDVKG